MNKKSKLKHILEYKDYSEHLDNLEYYKNNYNKNQHEGAEYCCVMLEPKIKIFGECENDPSKSESGKPHFHIFTEFGETEFYFNVNPFSITYKDGFKMLEKDEEELHKKLMTNCDIPKDVSYYSALYTCWHIKNENNS